MQASCKLNNKSMRSLRRSQEYQCIMIDLMNLGVITKDQCVQLIGSGVPNGLVLPGETPKPIEQPKENTNVESNENIENTENTENTEGAPDPDLLENSEQTEE